MSRQIFQDVFGGRKVGACAKKGPTSYTTGGFEVEAKELGLRGIDFAVAMAGDTGVHFAVARINTPNEDITGRSTCNVMVYVGTTGAEVAAAVNLSGITFRVMGVGH